MRTLIEGEEFYQLKKDLKEVKRFPARYITFYIRENGEKWVQDKPHPELHGGGLSRLTLVDKFPDFENTEWSSNEYYGQEAFIFIEEQLKLVKQIPDERIRYYIDKEGQKWVEEYVSNLKTDGNLLCWIHTIDEFPWE